MTATPYDEFGLFRENAEEAGLPWAGPPVVRREDVEVEPGRAVSALVWGEVDPEIVLLHGGAQNAHTWDTVALALGRPLVAVDLPGHGHSGWRPDHVYLPTVIVEDVAVAVRALAPRPRLVVGMSLGGLTAIALAARHPDLVPRLVVVDVTPGTDRERAEPIAAFVSGPERFATFDEILDRTVAFNPTRSVSSLRRGILHNAHQDDDGSWVWRYDRNWTLGEPGRSGPLSGEQGPDFRQLWDDLERVKAPTLLVRGEHGLVGDDDAAEFTRRHPGTRVEIVAGAGHSVQGDQPVELARLLAGFLAKGEVEAGA